ncbi:hypothetical protein JTB14_000360 [Gonioctena quinquepunctata]|nr:hypothetical protein JTB14_000360 [Gonioctena quinquepunctata]
MNVSLKALICGLLASLSCLLLLLLQPVEREVPGWGYDVSRNTGDYLNHHLPPLIVPENLCAKNVFLLIMVCSAPANSESRNAIRETWGSQENLLGHSVYLNFFIGGTSDSSLQRDLLEESSQYGDIIQENFIDSYYNLTLKTIHMLKVTVRHCSNTNFLLKIDDDMYVNVPKMMSLLLGKGNSKNLLLGRKACRTTPIRSPWSKWYTPKYIYDKEVLPDFLSGTGYLMSLEVAQKLHVVSKLIPLIHLEDLYTTGICAEKAGITPEHNGDFTYGILPDEPCIFYNTITMHHFSPGKLRKTHKELSSPSIKDHCSGYEQMFSAPYWLLTNILMPRYHSSRKRICQ